MNLEACCDEELIEIYRQGQEQAIEELFGRYKNMVRKKARAMFLAGGDSDDLIQEGMIGLYKAVRDFDRTKDASFCTFAGMCINRQMATAVTASNRKKNVPLNTYVSFDLPANADSGSSVKLADVLQQDMEQNPEDLFISRERTRMLKEKLLAALSRFERQVLDLYLEGKDYQQIARELNRPPKSIDNALQRIRGKAGQFR